MSCVFVHGLGQTPDSWKEVMARLDLPVESICPSLPEIASDRGADYKSLYAGFEEICDRAGKPLDLCGLSLGGVLALDYAVRHPQNVRSLVLIATQYKAPKIALRIQNLLFRFMPSQTFGQTGFDKEGFIEICRSMAELDLSGSLGNVACPVLVVCGEDDKTNRAASERLAGILPGAELRIISGAGHEVNTEAPHELAGAVQEFWETVSSE